MSNSEDIKAKIEKYQSERKYCAIYRKMDKHAKYITNGYILEHNREFVIVYEVEDFIPRGCAIIPMHYIKKVKRDGSLKFADNIMEWEGIKDKVAMGTPVDLTSYVTLFNSLKRAGKNVIVQNESPHIDMFVIGPIAKVTSVAIFIRFFDTRGYTSDELTRITFTDISKIVFDDYYIEAFSKYLRKREPKERSE
ncbi:hypothetical protein BH09BAC1_BH09BAC1_11240 [soil metagenome]